MNVNAYLHRIQYRGSLEPTAETLRALHRAHMYTVPFENLDIPLRRPIGISLPAFYDKVVGRRRGGFCYELNGLFGWLLEELGFQVEVLSGQVFSQGRPGPEFDHMLLLVEAGTGWVADVGFGDSFTTPLPLGTGEQAGEGRLYRLIQAGRHWEMHQNSGSGWQAQYRFTLQCRRLDDFEAMCQFQQTSPESSFTRKSVASLATPDGRITLSGAKMIVTAGGERHETPVQGPEDLRRILRDRFGLELGEGVDLGVLLAADLRA